MLNDLIRRIAEAGLSGTVYNAFHLVNIAALGVFVLWYRKKYSLSAGQALTALLLTYPLSYLWVLVITWVENGFQNFGANNIVRGFIYFPLIALLPAKLLHIEKERLWDFIAPCFAWAQAVAHLACPFAGCCHGYPSSWGLWNPVYKQILFPIQPLESLVSLLVCIICVAAAKREHYSGSGKIYPLFLVLFGSTRFFLEFLRDNNKVIGNISDLALHAALMLVVGVVWLRCIKGKEIRAAMQKKSKVKAKH